MPFAPAELRSRRADPGGAARASGHADAPTIVAEDDRGYTLDGHHADQAAGDASVTNLRPGA
ncbi:hypothetical protein [Dactylosporangium darangshiense]|uniref:hypothetical protein n=1 Tax=Dactylosporangium darangshiense TaxID=579108 RepID=UPI0031E83152